MRVWAIGILSLASACASAQPTPVVETGWHSIIVSVNDTDTWVKFWRDTNGYEVLYQGRGDPALYDGLAHGVTVLRNPGTNRGYVRLIQFDQPAEQIRPDAQTWDVGGWFDFNVRSLDLASKSSRLNAIGWHGYSQPVEFSFGPFVVKEWLTRGPDGVVLAIIERVEPPLENWPHLKNISRVFNATAIVEDLDEAMAFYAGVLGFQTYLSHEAPSKTAGPNVLGLPQNMATEVTRRVKIVHPRGTNEGSLELLEFVGADGNDYSARSQPPARGILALRYEVDSLVAVTDRFAAADWTFQRVNGVQLANVGVVDLVRTQGTAGEWLEFYEVLR